MKYLAFTQYIYALVALVFFYMAYERWSLDTDEKWLMLILGIMCLVLFAVRYRFLRRMKQRQGK